MQPSDFTDDQECRRFDTGFPCFEREILERARHHALSRLRALLDDGSGSRTRNAARSELRENVLEMSKSHVKDNGLPRPCEQIPINFVGLALAMTCHERE